MPKNSIEKFFSKPVKLGLPDRIEVFLIFLYAVFFLWWDVLQNIVLLQGTDYRVTWFGDITTNALDLGIIILFLYHVVLFSLFLLSLRRTSTHRQWDVIVAALALFGVAIVLAGFINNLYSDTIRFLFVNMSSTSFYHIGVGIQMFAGAYWAFTK